MLTNQMNTHSISLIGRRNSNEDKHLNFININNSFCDKKCLNFFGIWDGHGGKEVSKYLYQNYNKYFVSKYMEYNYKKYKDFKNYIIQVHKHIQEKLEIEFKHFSYRVGSTSLTSFFFKEDNRLYYYIANLGDCRAVLCDKNNNACQLTQDHKPNSTVERSRISKMGGKIYYDGFDWRIKDLSVSRAFGDMDAKPYVSHIPDIFKYSLRKSDKFIILACDGLWDVLTNNQAISFVLGQIELINRNLYGEKIQNINKKNNSKDNIAKLLAEHAIIKGSTDNISITIIFF